MINSVPDVIDQLEYLAIRLSNSRLGRHNEPEVKTYSEGLQVTIRTPDFSCNRVIQRSDSLYDIFHMHYSFETSRNGLEGYEFSLRLERGAKLSGREIDAYLAAADLYSNIPPDADEFVCDVSERLFQSVISESDTFSGKEYTRLESGLCATFGLKAADIYRRSDLKYTNEEGLSWYDLSSMSISRPKAREWVNMTEGDMAKVVELFNLANPIALDTLNSC